MTRDVLLQFIATLDPEMQELYHRADRFAVEAADTLTNDFQIAATIVSVFERKAEEAHV